eukprot:7346937-Alexandrium_andersonii.AAC.1
MERWRGLRERPLDGPSTGRRSRRIQEESLARGEECRTNGDSSASTRRGCVVGMPSCASCVSEPGCPSPPR